MNYLISPDTEDGRSQDVLIASVDQYLHETTRVALLHGAADPGHGPRRNQCRPISLPDLPFRHPSPPQRGIDIERIGGNTVSNPASIVIQKICRDDFEIVV